LPGVIANEVGELVADTCPTLTFRPSLAALKFCCGVTTGTCNAVMVMSMIAAPVPAALLAVTSKK
jgi:hypothetical protein